MMRQSIYSSLARLPEFKKSDRVKLLLDPREIFWTESWPDIRFLDITWYSITLMPTALVAEKASLVWSPWSRVQHVCTTWSTNIDLVSFALLEPTQLQHSEFLARLRLFAAKCTVMGMPGIPVWAGWYPASIQHMF